MRELHDELNEAVFAAYGWPADLTDEEILGNVVSLNAQRIAEERSGIIRWLRTEYQAPNELLVQTTLTGMVPIEGLAATRRKQPWPTNLPDRYGRSRMRCAPSPCRMSSRLLQASSLPAERASPKFWKR